MHFLLLLILLLVLLQPTPSLYACQSVPDPDAFLLGSTADIQILPNGLLMVSYADPLTGRVTHVTLHRVLATLPASPDDVFAQDSVPVILYQSERTGGGLVYAVSANPLYFGTDPAGDGFPARLWEDALEDGLNGNEVYIQADGAVEIVPGQDVPDA
ncbi:MAG: hypothetical protein AB1411_01620 [Nitrospirota bacterium]